MGYDNICKVVIDFYRDRYHMDITLSELFDEWARFRRDETAAKTGTVRRDVSLWRTHCEMVNVDGHILRDTKVTAVTPKLLQHFFRGLTKDRTYTRQSICPTNQSRTSRTRSSPSIRHKSYWHICGR